MLLQLLFAYHNEEGCLAKNKTASRKQMKGGTVKVTKEVKGDLRGHQDTSGRASYPNDHPWFLVQTTVWL